MSKLYTDVLIIGGGVIGSSICYYLSKEGIDTVLVEKSGIASGTSGACDGFIFLQSKKDKDIIKLTLEGLKIFDGLSDELSYDIEFEKCGGLVIFTKDNDSNDKKNLKYKDNIPTYNNSGRSNSGIYNSYDLGKSFIYKDLDFDIDGENDNNKVNIEKLDLKELKKVEPFISEKVVKATYCSEEAQVNPINLNFGFIEAAKRNGAKILTYEKVVSFDLQLAGKESAEDNLNKKIVNEDTPKEEEIKAEKKIKKVYTSSGREIIAREIVCACGAWSKELGDLAGLKIPVKPRKGNLIVTEALPKVINHVILDFDYLCCKYEEDKYEDNRDKEDRDIGFTIEQTKNGNLLIGSTREFVGFNDRVDFDKLSKVIGRAIEIFPFLKEVSIIRTFCGFRPYSIDFLPLMGKAKSFNNFWLATGHEGDGIALSPVTGLLISRMIADKINYGKGLNNFLNINLEKFSQERI